MSEAVTTPLVRVSYPNVLEARSTQGGTPQFSITMLFDKTNTEHMAFLKQLKAQCEAVLIEGWPDESKRPRIPAVGHDKSPIKDADKNCNTQGIPLAEKNPETAGHYIVRASSNEDFPPAVVDAQCNKVMSKGKVYGGVWCHVNINPYARKRADNPGISVGLNGVQVIKEDDAFGGGRPSVDSMFSAQAGAGLSEEDYGLEGDGSAEDFFDNAPSGSSESLL